MNSKLCFKCTFTSLCNVYTVFISIISSLDIPLLWFKCRYLFVTAEFELASLFIWLYRKKNPKDKIVSLYCIVRGVNISMIIQKKN